MYFSPVIDSTGLHLPLYDDILRDLINSYKNIYGQDVYLGNDSADYQWISVVAKHQFDTMQALQLDYNNRSPLTAVGVALDGLVKQNGMTRKIATYSTCMVVVSGIPQAVIVNGIAQDVSGNDWALPALVTIGVLGTETVSATCKTLGKISALPGSIIKIATPQYGWLSVNNEVAANLGQPIETDAQLRARQSISTRLASHTMLAGTIAGVAAVADVTRYNIHENYTSYTDSQGCPEHSVTCVVEGGTDLDVATAIFYNRGIGCYTNGTTSVDITDPDTAQIMAINFMRPEYLPVYVAVHVKKLFGYTDSITTEIEQAIFTYLNSLQIGQNLTISALYGAALSVMPDLTSPMFSITLLEAGVEPDNLHGDDLVVSFNTVTQGILGASPPYIIIEVTG
jgi:uncharacterized phage protein gp47/JayE